MRKSRITLQQKYWLSFLLIFFIPFAILGSLLYFNVVVQLRKQIETSTLERLTLAKHDFERTMDRLEGLSVLISSDPKLTPYFARANANQPEGTVRELIKYKSYNPMIEDIVLYYRDDANLYSTRGISSVKTLVDHVYSFPPAVADDVRQLLDGLERPMIIPVDMTVNHSGDSPRLLAFMMPIPANSLLYYGAAVFILDQRKLTEIIDQTLGEFSGSIVIFDKDNTVIAANNSKDRLANKDLVSMMSMYRENGLYEATMHKMSYSLSVVKSTKLDWSIVAAMPTRQFLSPVIDTRSFLMIGALVLIIIGAGMSMLLSRNFYRPIRRLLDQIKPHLTNQPEETGNELQYIQDTWLRTRLQNESLHKQMEHQLGYVRDQFLYQLIRGSNPDYEDWNTTHPDQSLQLEGERFFVALVLPDISADRPLHSGEIERMTQLFSHIAIPDLLDAYGLELVERFTFAFIACVTDTILPAKEVQRLMAIEIHDCLQGQVGLKAIVGFGHSYPRLDMINRSYIEAAAAADYRMMTGNDGFIFFEDIGQVEHRHLWLPAAVQLRFVQSLKQGDRGMARQMLHAMIESIRTDVKSYLMSKLVCVDLINSAAKVIHELQIEDRSGLIKKSAEFKQLDELESTIGEMITLICDHVQTMQEQRQYRLSTDILEAVKEQFRSPGMSLDYLAERFQLSTSYISRFLKEHSGILFSEYLFQLRYEEAKRMLVETDRTVKEIVNSVGYVGESKFIERFKKKEGVTPGQYRKIHAEKSKAESERKV